MTDKLLHFTRGVSFLFIKKGDIFKVRKDYDNREYIRLKNKMKIYLTEKRNILNYYRIIDISTDIFGKKLTVA